MIGTRREGGETFLLNLPIRSFIYIFLDDCHGCRSLDESLVNGGEEIESFIIHCSQSLRRRKKLTATAAVGGYLLFRWLTKG